MSPWSSDALVRAELFSIERLEQHAESLADAQPVAGSGARARTLAGRVRDNHHQLVEAHRALVKASADGQPMTPAAQWLTDNFHVVEAQISGIRQDLPSGYYRQLPKLATGPFVGYPRVLGLSWAFVAHTDSHFDPNTLCRFVRAYQHVQPLSIGELWAVPITLRIVLIENLRRAATRIIENRVQRQQANAIADTILGTGAAGTAVARAATHARWPAAPDFRRATGEASARSVIRRDARVAVARRKPRGVGNHGG
jgi:cyclic beta-1,2-glucan synthetase